MGPHFSGRTADKRRGPDEEVAYTGRLSMAGDTGRENEQKDQQESLRNEDNL